MKRKMKVLIVEDLTSDAELAEREIRKTLTNIEVQVVETEDKFRTCLSGFKPDLIVSDFAMPKFDGLEALRIAREEMKFVPFIILTGSVNEDTAVLCMKAGADDYVIKEHISRLGSAINNAIKTKRIEKEHEEALLQLKESEEKYRSLIENSNDGIFLFYNGKFEIINKKLEQIYGYTQKELNENIDDILDLVAPKSRKFIKDRLERSQNKILDKAKYEFTGLNKNGDELDLEASVGYIPYKDGIATQSIIRDISDRKLVEKELRNAKEKAEESDRLKSAFLLNISHEIRTPMNGILGFIDLLFKPNLTEADKLTYREIIKQSSDRLINTVTDLIDLAHIETKQVQINTSKTNLPELLENLRCIYNSKSVDSNNKLVVKNDTREATYVNIDKDKLNRILGNLLSNAIKFTHEGTIEYGYQLYENKIEFFVNDTGIGIPKERQEAIFNSFVQADLSLTRAYEGTGLGLTISKAYTELLGGKIELESEEGKGARFKVILPLESHISEDQPIKNKKDLKEANILIVEDDKMSSEYLEELLKDEVNNIFFAKNGRESVEICKTNNEISLILMDLKMPVMDGKTATRKIREFNKDVVIIAQTAYAMEGDENKAIEAGCNDYIAKPINENTLFSILEKYLNK